MKILIIEDDPTSLKLASDVLQAGGHVIMLAATADQALLSLHTARPDAILLDMRLPGVKGLCVARHCRSEAGYDTVPIIAVTAYPEEFPKETARAAGCDGYIIKPINTRTLTREIEAAAVVRNNRLAAS